MSPFLLQHLVAVSWLLLSLGAGAFALRHFWLKGKPAPTATVIALSTAGTFFCFWPQMRGFLALPGLFTAMMFVALVLALTAFALPVVSRVQSWQAKQK